MRIPFLNRVPTRKLTIRTTGSEAVKLTSALKAVLAQLPDVQLLYLADNRTAQVLGFYTTSASLNPDQLAQEHAQLYQRPPQAVGATAKPTSELREATYLFEHQLHLTSVCQHADWHWGIVAKLPDVSLALVRSVLRDQSLAL
ncbi:MAG TPA: hypothetical protein VK364_03910 [Hymenobacter sp.]|nr:hypothetical protein [Hymenobacter sp.]